MIVFIFSSCNEDDAPCTKSIWYADSDKDGFGNPCVTKSSCNQPKNFVLNSDDIDDTDANVNPNTIWQGDKITFTKADYADWTLEANQDRITNNVWITRANYEGIFNIVTETGYTDDSSPADTEWALGTTANIRYLVFQDWESTSVSKPPSLVNKDMVVHLITDSIYIDIKFTSWTSGGEGGEIGRASCRERVCMFV